LYLKTASVAKNLDDVTWKMFEIGTELGFISSLDLLITIIILIKRKEVKCLKN